MPVRGLELRRKKSPGARDSSSYSCSFSFSSGERRRREKEEEQDEEKELPRGDTVSCRWRRAALLGLSFTLAFSLPARAGDILRGGAPAGQRGAASAFGSNPAITTAARNNAKDVLARTTQSVQAVQAMQAAARAAAIAGPNHLGTDPNHPGQLLPTVPNGLTPGGLQVLPGVPANLASPQPGENPALWTGAQLPTQTAAGGRTVVTVKQTVAQAVLNWRTLNVGKQTTLKFDQSAGGANQSQWIAFNRITDPSGSPTQILGQIEGSGQAYILNQNGILFGGSSQVNLHALTASSLPINDNLLTRGLLNNPDAQFLFSALPIPAGSDGTPSFTPPTPLTPNQRVGDVVVQKGAAMSSPVSADGNGGRIMLIGANVRNEGTIATPSGQTILAAGLQVGVAAHARSQNFRSTTGDSSEPSLRGLDTWVGAVGDYAGTVTNTGAIEVLTGSTWLTGRQVGQLGVVESSTSVNLNGRIDLRASYGAVPNEGFESSGPMFINQGTGVVTLGAGSSTRILPDYASERKVPGTSLPEKSQINVEGLAVNFQERAVVLAPNGDVTIRAGIWPGVALPLSSSLPTALFPSGGQKFLLSGGQIYLDPSSVLSVAGSTDVLVPLAHSILEVEFRGPELADSPLQRAGVLRATPLSVDLRRSGSYNGRYWIGTALGDVTGVAGLIERNAAQLTAVGGTVNLSAGGSLVVRTGAKIDVSGGFYQHEAGFVQTTRLLQSGHLVDIANALPDQVYDGIYTGTFTTPLSRWGAAQTYQVPFMTGRRFEDSYLEGAAAGTLTLTAPSMALDGELRGLAVQGPRQRSSPATPGSLAIKFAAEEIFLPALATDPRVLLFSPNPPAVVFSRDDEQAEPGAFQLTGGTPAPLRAERTAQVMLSPRLLDEQGFGSLSVENGDGSITVPDGVKLAAPAAGSVSLIGANVTIQGSVTAPGGKLNFVAYTISPRVTAEFQATPVPDPLNPPASPVANAARGLFTLASGATLSTAGLLLDERVDGFPDPLVLNGGMISVATYRGEFARGSTLDVSGGVDVTGRGRVTYGSGGSIAIQAGRDPGFARLLNGALVVIDGPLKLDSTLLGYSGGKGGSLSLLASLIQIGGTASTPQTLLLQPEFFQQGGFTNYDLTGIGVTSANPSTNPVTLGTYAPAILIAPGTGIAPTAESWLAVLNVAGSERAGLRRLLKPAALRSPASLSFTALGLDDSSTIGVLDARGDIVMGAGARIAVDAAAGVGFKGQTVTLLGAVEAPGGRITVEGANSFPVGANPNGTLLPFARTTVFLGPEVRLSAAGTVVYQPDAFDRRLGSVLSGGSISVKGNIVASAGAVLDVSGSAGTFDLAETSLGKTYSTLDATIAGLRRMPASLRTVPTVVESSGGTITLQGGQLLYADATLLGKSGGRTALGGFLAISSGPFTPESAANRTSADINLTVRQSGNVLPASASARGIGQAVLSASGDPTAGGHFAVDRFGGGGFDALDLGFDVRSDPNLGSVGGNIQFVGPVSIAARGALRVASGGALSASAPVALTAPYVVIGQPFAAPLNPTQTVLNPFLQVQSGAVSQLVFAPTTGPGNLAIRADLIDVGTLSLQQIGRAQLIADGGDIRGNGSLNIAGDLTLRAAQVYPTTLSTFDIFAYDPAGGPGSVTVARSGEASAPVSIGGNLNIFASNIFQGGVLRAPLGTITLGWDGTDYDPTDADFDQPVNRAAQLPNPVLPAASTAPRAVQVVLGAGSLTSVTMNGLAGKDFPIPFGLSPDGSSWIDPRGVNVTTDGLPTKQVSIRGGSVIAVAGSTVDLRGGGDLYAYRFVAGNGGSVDLLGTASANWTAGTEYQAGDLVFSGGQTWSARVRHTGQTPSVSPFWSLLPESYAIIPGFDSKFAPYTPYNTDETAASRLGGDPGLVSNLRVGEQISLQASPGLKAGVYTLLPRRYATLPGAFLVTPSASATFGTLTLPAGETLVSGVRYSQFNQPRELSPVLTRFEVFQPDVVAARVTYDDYLGNTFFAAAAARFEIAQPQRLPIDSGYLAFHGNTVLQPDGGVLTSRPGGGRGATIDLSSLANISVVGGSGTGAVGATAVVQTGIVNGWGAESVLIGGLRRQTLAGTVVDVRTDSLLLDNPGATLSGPEITLAARTRLTVATGSSVASTGKLTAPAENLLPGADGTLLRVSGDPSAVITRTGTPGAAGTPLLEISAGVRLSGAGVIVDSTYGTQIDPAAQITSGTLTLGSGQISISFNPPAGNLAGQVVPTQLVLAGSFLEDIQQVGTLTLRSYRTIDVYGPGTFGSAALGSLRLLASGLRGYGQAGQEVAFQAGDILLAGPSPALALGAPATVSGTLRFDAGTVRLGAETFAVQGYQNLALNAAGGLLGEGRGTLTTQGNLTIAAPVIAGAGSSSHVITAGGGIALEAGTGTATIAAGLGASFSFTGTALTANTTVLLPSGQLTLRATTGDLQVGGLLDLRGTGQDFYDLTRFSDGGSVTLTSDLGDVEIAVTGRLSVAAAEGGGNAGTIAISAARGIFDLATGATFLGNATRSQTSGSFRLDTGTLASFTELSQVLNAGGFFEKRDVRVRTGDILIENPTTGANVARDFTVSADGGSITVTGKIDASGLTGGLTDRRTGGNILLTAQGSVVLVAGAELTAAAEEFSNAGKGGDITLEAGARRDGIVSPTAKVDLEAGSKIDLSVAAFVPGSFTTPGSSAFNGQFTGKLHLRAPQNATFTDLLVDPLDGTITGASSILVEGYRVYDLTGFGGIITGAVQTQIQNDGLTFLGAPGTTSAGYTAMSGRLLLNNAGLSPQLVLAPGAEIINSATAATLNFNLNAVNSTVTVASTGGIVTFPGGTPGNNTIRSSSAGTITSASGVVTTLAANAVTALAAGSSVTLATGGTLTFVSGTGGAIPIGLTAGSTVTTGATNVSGTVAAVGSSVTLNTVTSSSLDLAAGTRITFPSGTPGNDTVRANVAGTITSAAGVVTALAANTSVTLAAGSAVNLNAAGRVTFFSGTGGAIPVALAAGSFTTNGATSVTAATGNLTLGTTADNAANDWNLSGFRFGPQSAPGVLTLRAAGDLVFLNALSDGFTPDGATTGTSLWLAPLTTINAALPINTQSWSYRLAAGSDLTAADFHQTPGAGSLLLGKFYATTGVSGAAALTQTAINNRYQVIRTGTGDIDIAAGRDVQLRNQFATIYTAGVRLPTPTTIYVAGDFSRPVVETDNFSSPSQGSLGAIQQLYPAQWSLAGGDVAIAAQANIRRVTGSALAPVTDTSYQLPTNWLYRRGFVDPAADGLFGAGLVSITEFDPATGLFTPRADIAASTAWWVDFSNFFQGVGALGGGNATLTAGGDIINVDAVLPTNARMPGRDPVRNVNLAPDADSLLQLGGGDLVVRAGNNLDGGIYYVERGTGTLFAGGSITTNRQRSSLGVITSAAETWLPTTVFVGDAQFTVSARSDILLGPASNVFLLPQGLNNRYWYKTYFNTFSADAALTVASFGGSVTHRLAAVSATSATPRSILDLYEENVNLPLTTSTAPAFSRPWIRLSERGVAFLDPTLRLNAPSLHSTAFAGNINIAGPLTLYPSPTGGLELASSGGIVGLQKIGTNSGGSVSVWSATTINVSDADPTAASGIASPLAFQAVVGSEFSRLNQSPPNVTNPLIATNLLFAETGSYTGRAGSAEIQQALHGTAILHAGDPNPVKIYAQGGDVIGVSLFSPKAARVLAGNDVTDVSLYIQNVEATDISVVAAGRDVIPFNENTALRSVASNLRLGNRIGDATFTTVVSGVTTQAKVGDIQINGPGVLEVLAGRDLDLGTGANITDGTGSGITSIGGLRNPNLGFEGADLIVFAGVGGAAGHGAANGLSGSTLDFSTLISANTFASGLTESAYLKKLGLSTTLGELTPEQEAIVALESFYRLLRDTGRGATLNGYAAGFTAIDAVFGANAAAGEILTRARDIRTSTGGAISIGVPAGGVTLASDIFGNPLTPPGIVTGFGGAISIFTDTNVDIGQARIFTLRGGDILIWSSAGDIAAGTASRTVVTAPPTRVTIDVTSADLQTDLGGLATGGGIGALAAVVGVPLANIDLVAPTGTVDAGDAGIRLTGNLNIAAVAVLNASNIQAGGTTSGVPAAPAAPPPALPPSSPPQDNTRTTPDPTKQEQERRREQQQEEQPSIITVEVLGYGGGE